MENKSILLSAASGFIGKELKGYLEQKGYEVHTLVRHVSSHPREISWNAVDEIEKEKLGGFFAVIHLSGENIGALRWSKDKKRRIEESRVKSTEFLTSTLNSLVKPPETFICASAIGYFGSRIDEKLTENSSPGAGFLAEVVQKWEKAARRFSKGRVVCTRFGAVLSLKGGMLKAMLPPFKLGLGGKIGDGSQWISWISIDDLLQYMHHVIETKSLEGPIHFTTPHPVTNAEFTKTLCKVLKRPALAPLPKFFVKAVFGEAGEALLLSSVRALPEKIGISCAYPTLEKALEHICKNH